MMEEINRTRESIARFGRLLFDRQLTDAAGGNISVRVGDHICLSPRYSGQKHQWQLDPEDVLVLDREGRILEGAGQLSRESQAHLRLHRDFGDHGVAVIHSHPRNVLVFAAARRPIPPVLEATLKFGTIPVVDFAPSHTANLAENIAGAMRGQEERIRKHAAAAIAPWHGLFVMGKDLDAAFDAVERIDTNAYCILMGQHIGWDDSHRQALESEHQLWSSK
jgi:L-fuculose-phosphate aldolase